MRAANFTPFIPGTTSYQPAFPTGARSEGAEMTVSARRTRVRACSRTRHSVEPSGHVHQEAAIHLYDAGHGFNCVRHASYDEAAAKLANRRTLDFFGAHPG